MVFILVLYKCKLNDSTGYLTIARSLIHARKQGILYIFDNSPEKQNIENVDVKIWKEIEYCHCPENKGVSTAYNSGVVYAKEKNATWVMLLDQDTIFAEDYIHKLNIKIAENQDIKLFVPIILLANRSPFSPSLYKHKRGYSVRLEPGIYSLLKYSPVNSGMVINIDSFLEVNGYDVNVGLDFSDFQFIERFRKKNDKFYLLETTAIQSFSNDELDIDKLKERFKIYCKCAKNCTKITVFDEIDYLHCVFRHLVGLVMKTKKITFTKIFINYYLR